MTLHSITVPHEKLLYIISYQLLNFHRVYVVNPLINPSHEVPILDPFGSLGGVIFGRGMDLWGLYNRYQPGDANGFRSDEEENQGQAADAWRSKVKGCKKEVVPLSLWPFSIFSIFLMNSWRSFQEILGFIEDMGGISVIQPTSNSGFHVDLTPPWRLERRGSWPSRAAPRSRPALMWAT